MKDSTERLKETARHCMIALTIVGCVTMGLAAASDVLWIVLKTADVHTVAEILASR